MKILYSKMNRIHFPKKNISRYQMCMCYFKIPIMHVSMHTYIHTHVRKPHTRKEMHRALPLPGHKINHFTGGGERRMYS
jgi:hypothetical protein